MAGRSPRQQHEKTIKRTLSFKPKKHMVVSLFFYPKQQKHQSCNANKNRHAHTSTNLYLKNKQLLTNSTKRNKHIQKKNPQTPPPLQATGFLQQALQTLPQGPQRHLSFALLHPAVPKVTEEVPGVAHPFGKETSGWGFEKNTSLKQKCL